MEMTTEYEVATKDEETASKLEMETPKDPNDAKVNPSDGAHLGFQLFLERLGFMEADQADTNKAPKLSYLELFKVFLWFGCRAFGGPVAQIQMMKQELVVEQKWIDTDRFMRVYAVYQILPGPEVRS